MNAVPRIVVALVFLISIFGSDASAQKHIYMTQAHLNAIKARVDQNQEPWKSAWQAFQGEIQDAMNARPRSVVDNGGPYYNGPGTATVHHWGNDRTYSSDGVNNEASNREDAYAFFDMSEWVRNLGLAYGITGNDAYARKAIDFLHHWCLKPATYMIPSAKTFGPHTKGANGNANEASMYNAVTRLVFGASFVMDHAYWNTKGANAKAQIRQWFQDYYTSLQANPSPYDNNFETRHVELSMAISSLLGNTSGFNKAVSAFKAHVDQALSTSGSNRGMPRHEVKRAAGISYSMIVMMVLYRTAEIAHTYNGTDLWSYTTAGQPVPALEALADYMAPYLSDPNIPERWESEGRTTSGGDVTEEELKEFAGPYEMAYLRLGKRTYMDVIRRGGRPLVGEDRHEPLTLLYASGAGEAVSSPQTPPPPSNSSPSVALKAPADKATFTAPAGITLEADAADADGSVVKVEFYANGTKIGEDRSRSFVYNWTGVAAGSYRITAKATDDDGAQTTSAPITVYVAGRAGGGISLPSALDVVRVSAGTAQLPNVAANVLDDDLATRWSAQGNGQRITFDLGSVATVKSLKVAWFRGDRRRATFDVEVSTDGKAWTRVFSGRSSGTTRQLEAYDVADRDARYVRLVGHGNSDNNWNSVTEVKIYGALGADAGGDAGTDVPPTYVWLEAEAGSPTAPLRTLRDGAASGGRYVRAPKDRTSTDVPPADGRATYRFSVAEAGTYRVWGRVIVQDTGTDSFWIRMDGGDWVRWNEIDAGTAWHWDAVHDTDNGNAVVDFRLSSGVHTLEVAYRERRAQLDKLLVTDDLGYVPGGAGGSAAKAGTELVASSEQVQVERAPESYRLEENYPNPFNPSTTITYHLPKAAEVTLSVYNALGRRVATLVSGEQPAGTHEVRWDSRDTAGLAVPSGLYFYRIEAGGFQQTRKMLLLK